MVTNQRQVLFNVDQSEPNTVYCWPIRGKYYLMLTNEKQVIHLFHTLGSEEVADGLGSILQISCGMQSWVGEEKQVSLLRHDDDDDDLKLTESTTQILLQKITMYYLSIANAIYKRIYTHSRVCTVRMFIHFTCLKRVHHHHWETQYLQVVSSHHLPRVWLKVLLLQLRQQCFLAYSMRCCELKIIII